MKNQNEILIKNMNLLFHIEKIVLFVLSIMKIQLSETSK